MVVNNSRIWFYELLGKFVTSKSRLDILFSYILVFNDREFTKKSISGPISDFWGEKSLIFDKKWSNYGLFGAKNHQNWAIFWLFSTIFRHFYQKYEKSGEIRLKSYQNYSVWSNKKAN